MSRTAKLTLGIATSLTGLTVWGVHFLQSSERDAMYQGVLRDDERIRVRRAQIQREEEFEEQKRRRAYLEHLQPISNPSGPRPEKSHENSSGTHPEPVKLEGCKTC